MKVFTRVVEAGTFTRAAESLEIPKATVTKLVQWLESHLRVKLLQRTTRRVTVTADGAAYYERALRLLADLDDLDASVASAQVNPRGRLRVDTGSSSARLVLIPALPEFFARYPDIQLTLGVTDRPVDLVSDSVDCVIRGGDVIDQSLVARRIGSFKWAVCAAPGYIERHGTPKHPRDIDNGHVVASYLSTRTGRPRPLRFVKGGERIEIEAPGPVAINDSNAHLAAGVAGLGIIQTLAFMTQPHVARGELVPLLADWQPEALPVSLAYPANRHLSNRLRVFIDWAVEVFARVG